MRLTIPFGALEAAPRMSADEQALVIARNRERYAAGHEQPRSAAADREQTPPPRPQQRRAERRSRGGSGD